MPEKDRRQGPEGGRDERSTGPGGHAQRRVHPDIGRQARSGTSAARTSRLGDLPPQGLARRSEPALCVAVQRLVRAGDPALRRRRQDVGAGRQRVRVRRRPRHAPVVRRHAAPLGVQARLASRTVADRSGHRLRRGGRRRPVPLDRRRPDLAGASGPAQPRVGAVVAAGRRRACACTRSCSIPGDPERIFIAISAAGAFRTDDGGKTWRPINRGPEVRSTSPTRMPRSATASTASRCTRRGRTCCSCRSTGT